MLDGKINEGYLAYMNGVFLLDNKIWYPIALANLSEFLNNKGVKIDDQINRIIDRMKFYSMLGGKKLEKNVSAVIRNVIRIVMVKTF